MKNKETARQRFIRVDLYDRLTDVLIRRKLFDTDEKGKELRQKWYKWAIKEINK